MRSRRPSPEHQDAVTRRLALLSAELSAVQPPPAPAGRRQEGEWWDEHTRLAESRRPAATWAEPPGLPSTASPHSSPAPPVPVPGRHAARRVRLGSGLLPATLRGRVLLGPAQLAVVAVLVAVGLAVTAWWVVRSDAEPAAGRAIAAPTGALVQPAQAGPDAAVAAVSDGAAAAPATSPATVTVDVAGKVRRPGIAVLDAGSRVVDALEAAGGVRPGVHVSDLNLARVLIDGEQILVGVPAPPGVAATSPPAAGGAPAALVNLNTADEGQLETLPEVGPVTAAAIVAWRDTHGGFSSVDELLEVDGIGEATLAKIAPHVTV
ncbi:ComEA family DNA-binding protein [Nocardioides sp.]|uniref:ComEA family DNA-binding protein n=1 Tax=Nocardioides sp. TaxID=35761 RepID=UPI001A292415|nr:ComEA family DNA-binding protein [Nocardioides sp.]MBJ7358623.1 ComEA family DNA-binding protein [Nocardioides sp.]